MRRITAQAGWFVLAGIILTITAGCFGFAQNPSYFPHLLPTGDIIRTHARPPGFGYFSNFDPHAYRLEVRPVEITNPVQTQQVILATVYDETGKPRRKRRLEWMLEGAGNIVEVDESGYTPGRGYKVDNKYAVSYTNLREHQITRGNANPNDDYMVRPGQTWCVITSAVEGDTHMTAYAPEIANWDARQVIIKAHWVDVEWTLPPPSVNRAGSEQAIVTHVFRHTDHQPLANYRVRYRILDGPPALFMPAHAQETIPVSDLNGNAGEAMVQVSPQPGTNRIGIEIIRPPDPCAPSGTGIVIGRGETTVEWQAPAVALAKTGPAIAGVGQEIDFTIAVTNTGKVETRAMTIRDAIPDGLQYVRSTPPAAVEPNQLTWTLGALTGGQIHTVQGTFRTTRVGAVTNHASVTTVEGLKAESSATTQVTTPQLNVTMTGPTTVVVGVPITYQITVSNPGSGPATNVILSDQFDAGLEHESRANPVELKIGTVAPNGSQVVPLVLTARQPGRLMNRVAASADGNLKAQAELPVTAQTAQLKVSVAGPSVRYLDRPAIWNIRVSNPGDVSLPNVAVRSQLPPELAFTEASEGGQSTNGQVAWNIGALEPHTEKILQVTTRCLKLTPRAITSAIATAEPGIQSQAEATIEIRGLPAFLLAVTVADPKVEVNEKTTYKIDVTNQGSLPGNQVQITATVPPQMRPLDTNGPSKARIEGQKVIFPPVDSLLPKQTMTYTVDVMALQAGDVRFRVELTSTTLSQPVIKEQSTNIFGATPETGEGTAIPGPQVPRPLPVTPGETKAPSKPPSPDEPPRLPQQ